MRDIKKEGITMEKSNNINLTMLLEELKDLVMEMYCATVTLKIEVAKSGIKYDTKDLEMLDLSFNQHLALIEQCVDRNDFVNINSIIQKFRRDLQRSKLIPLNLTIAALHAGDQTLPSISNFISQTILKIDHNLANGMENTVVNKTL